MITMKQIFSKGLACSVFLGAIASVPVAASEAQGRVTRVYVMNDGQAMFHLDAPLRTGLPACAVNLPTRWAFNANTPAGQAKLSLVLTAYASGKELYVVGQNSCPDWGDTESVNFMYTI
jgi:hypothetical protein